MKSFKDFPDWKEVIPYKLEGIHEANAHIHTPYSFSAFKDLEEPFRMAVQEEVEVLGINDFNTVKGYDEFFRQAGKYGVFPLFNIEFIGLMEREQQAEVLVNDPNNPGRTYFSGKGLRYPWIPPEGYETLLEDLVLTGTAQVEQMVEKANAYFLQTVPEIRISFARIREKLAVDLVRERHVAKAIRLEVEKSGDAEKQQEIYRRMFGGTPLQSSPEDSAAVENELRARLLKKGGPAYIPEDPQAFLPVEHVIDFILQAGGIPCYPVLLDDAAGNFTGFEKNKVKLAERLEEMNVFAVEFIPGRNDCKYLEEYVEFFMRRGFLVLFGTEHNTPAMEPLKVSCRGNTPLPERLREFAWKSACIVAAHQYQIARGKTGFVNADGFANSEQRGLLTTLGAAVIGYFQKHHKS
jgi:hypothetical protein